MKNTQITYKAIIFITIVCSILAGLGIWQLVRRNQKLLLIQSIEQNVNSEGLYLKEISSSIPKYTKINISGEFKNEKSIALYGYRSAYKSKHGYYLLTPFKSEHGKTYLVSRGWFKNSTPLKDIDFSWENTKTNISAFVMPGEKAGVFFPENSEKLWFCINLKEAKEKLGTNEENFYLMQVNNQKLPKYARSLSANNLSKIRNDHLEYAITWFCLAAAAFVIFFLRARKKQ